MLSFTYLEDIELWLVFFLWPANIKVLSLILEFRLDITYNKYIPVKKLYKKLPINTLYPSALCWNLNNWDLCAYEKKSRTIGVVINEKVWTV